MNKVFFNLGCCFLFGTLSICLLFFISLNVKRHKNGFVRRLRNNVVSDERIYDLKYSSYFVAGATNSYIYLGNYNVTSHLLMTNYNFTDTHHLKLKKLDANKFAWPAIELVVDSPKVYAME